jgi:hypothetical protein
VAGKLARRISSGKIRRASSPATRDARATNLQIALERITDGQLRPLAMRNVVRLLWTLLDAGLLEN